MFVAIIGIPFAYAVIVYLIPTWSCVINNPNQTGNTASAINYYCTRMIIIDEPYSLLCDTGNSLYEINNCLAFRLLHTHARVS